MRECATSEAVHGQLLPRLEASGGESAQVIHDSSEFDLETNSAVSSSANAARGPIGHRRAYAGVIVTILCLAGLLACLSHDTTVPKPARIDMSALAVKELSEADLPSRLPKVYVYDLPAKFNKDLVPCYWGNPAKNQGYETAQGDLLGMKLYNTTQRSMEEVFHKRLLTRTDVLVTNPEEADLFYVPYYSYLSRWAFIRNNGCRPDGWDQYHTMMGNTALDAELFEFLNQTHWLKRKGGLDHMTIVSADCNEAYFARIEQTKGWTTGTMNGQLACPNSAKYADHFNIITVPFTSGLHCVSPDRCGWSAEPAGVERPTLALYIGSTAAVYISDGRRHERQNIVDSLKSYDNQSAVKYIDPSGETEFARLNRHMFEEMTNASFCFEPVGDYPARKGVYDSVLAGCVPVMFDKLMMDLLPFQSELPVSVDEFVLLLDDPRKAMEGIEAVSHERLAKLREAGGKVAWHYNIAELHSTHIGDAVDMFLLEGKNSPLLKRYEDEQKVK